jgi:hypothetical protein
MTGTLDATYRLVGLPVETLTEWDALQNGWLSKAAFDPAFAFSDESVRLVETDAKHRRIPIASGTLCMTREAITVGTHSIAIDTVTDMELVRRNLLVFSTRDAHYQISGQKSLNTRKYMLLYHILKGAK